MKIAIHQTNFYGAFTERWIDYCEKNNIPYKLVDKQRNHYYTCFEPIRNKYILALQRRGIFPSFLSIKTKLILTNSIRCESHRDLVVKTLEK